MTYEHDIPQYSCIRALGMEVDGKNARQAGFFVCPQDRERHNREISMPYSYRLVYSGQDIMHLSGIEGPDAIGPSDIVFQTSGPLPGTGESVRSVHLDFPTRDEVRDVCSLPALEKLTAGQRKDHLPFDVKGNRMLSACDWNYMTELAETNRMWKGLADKYREPISALVSTVDETELKVDFNLAGPMKTIIDAGFLPCAHCSGTVSDHPNLRYRDSDPLGRHRQGEPVAAGEGAFIEFKGGGTDGAGSNSDRQLQMVRDQALAAGWRVDDLHPEKDTLHICLPLTLDGSTESEISKEARLWMESEARRGAADPSVGYARAFAKAFREAADRHGGTYGWTDDEVIRRWEGLAVRLAWRANIEQNRGWLDEKDVRQIHLNPAKDKELFRQSRRRREAATCMYDAQNDLLEQLGGKVLDMLARRNGFGGYGPDIAGTGIRDYTRSGRTDPEVEARLKAFENDKAVLYAPFLEAVQRNRQVMEIRMDSEEQRYRQAVCAAAHPGGRPQGELEAERRERGRITDISVYHAGPERELRYFIRCKVDGVQQAAVPMTKSDARDYWDLERNIDLYDYAARYFRDALDRGRSEEQGRGMHR